MGKEFNKAWGDTGEEIAEVFLENLDYTIVARKFFFRGGEIDLIAKKDNWLVFVEVKLKRGDEFGTPEEMVTPYKIRRILKTAQLYMRQNKIDPEKQDWRVDVIAISFDRNDNRTINHIENAGYF